MKAYKTVLFMFSVIALLAIVCLVFPREGIRAGETTFTFPSLEEALSSDASAKSNMPSETPEELLARQLNDMRMQQQSQYLEYFKTSNIRINLPDDDLTFFDDLFAAFDAADSTHVGIMHYGDSQIEGDRITGTIREELQDTFGGIGPGIMPLMETVGSIHIGQVCSAELSRAFAYGPVELRAGNSNYGVMGQVAYLDTAVVVSLWPRTKQTLHCHNFTRLTVLAENPSSNLYVTCKGEHRTLEPSRGVKHITFQFDKPQRRASVSLSGYANIYGIVLDGETGVQVDNIGMRGCAGTMFTYINRNHLTDYCTSQNVRLIILQYGGNAVPYLKTDKSLRQYMGQMRRQIKYLQEVAPEAKVMLIGPSDMSTRIKGAWQTIPILPTVCDSLRSVALDSGAAYWDMYQAMGGQNSMAQWVEHNPPLAGSDHIHFTLAGGERVADLFCKSLMLYYDYYHWRKRQ
ncbi:MAG: hypothetical protein J6T94_02500 [Bacteroidaceae bacterium]|nr:hypothetical protein [Bacteroidaceae bacterium]